MSFFSMNEIRALGKDEFKALKKKADGGDSEAQFKIALSLLYGQQGQYDPQSCMTYLEKAAASGDPVPLLFMGFQYEHALGVTKSYTDAVNCYAKAYSLLNKESVSDTNFSQEKAKTEMSRQYPKLVEQVNSILEIKNFCTFKKGEFVFPWISETRTEVAKKLPQLSKDIAEFGTMYKAATTDLTNDDQGVWAYRYQDTLLMPLEVMKAVAARDYLEQKLFEFGYYSLPQDRYFNEAIGRCLIDDDDAYDNDFIIGGLLMMSGHDKSPLWQYRTALWYEYCVNSLEPKAAAYWYSQIQSKLDPAVKGLERLKNGVAFRMLDDVKYGSSEDCLRLAACSMKNPQVAISWHIEGALRGEMTSLRRLSNAGIASNKEKSVLDSKKNQESTPFYKVMEKESSDDKKVETKWSEMIDASVEHFKFLQACKEKIEIIEERLKDHSTDAVDDLYEQVVKQVNEMKDSVKANGVPLWKRPFVIGDPVGVFLEQLDKSKEMASSIKNTLHDAPNELQKLQESYKKLLKVKEVSDKQINEKKNLDKKLNALCNDIKGTSRDLDLILEELKGTSTTLSVDMDWKRFGKTVLAALFVLFMWVLWIPSYLADHQYSEKQEKAYQEWSSSSEGEESQSKNADIVNNADDVASGLSVKEKAEKIFDYVYSPDSKGLMKVEKNEKKGFIDSNGKVVVPPVYDYISSWDSDGWAKVENNSKKGFIATDGNTVKEVLPPVYDYISSWDSDGWAKVEIDNKKGFIVKNGNAVKEVLSPVYDFISSWDSDGWAKVEIDSKKGFIVKNGNTVKEIVPPIYDYIYSFSGGLAKVEKDGKTGYINREGKLVQPLE